MSSRKCTTDHITYDNSHNRYIVYVDGKTINYAVSRYGEYAQKLAELSLQTKRRYEDYFQDNEDGTTTFFVKYKDGVKEVLLDTEYADLMHDIKISVYKDNHAKTWYASTKYGKLHRLVVDVNGPEDIVDHIDRNGLNDTKANLRVVNVSINNRNATLRKDNKSGYKGILEEHNRFRVYYYDHEHNKCSKSFSKNKYGAEEALNMALEFRDNVYEKYGYIA